MSVTSNPSVFSHSLQFFDLIRTKLASFIVKYLFIIVFFLWCGLAWVSPIKLVKLYPTDTNINSIFLNIITIYLVIIASLALAFEKCIKIPEFEAMAKHLRNTIPLILRRHGYENKPEDFVTFTDKSIEDYKKLLEYRKEFGQWHRNIYICELFLIFVTCIFCSLDLALMQSPNAGLQSFWTNHRFFFYFNFSSIIACVILFHALIDALQYMLLNRINIDSSDKNILDKFNIFKQQKLNIGNSIATISIE